MTSQQILFNNETVGTGMALGGLFLVMVGLGKNWKNIDENIKIFIYASSLIFLVFASNDEIFKKMVMIK